TCGTASHECADSEQRSGKTVDRAADPTASKGVGKKRPAANKGRRGAPAGVHASGTRRKWPVLAHSGGIAAGHTELAAGCSGNVRAGAAEIDGDRSATGFHKRDANGAR